METNGQKNVDNTVVLGIFKSRAELENCVDRLKSDGFRSADVSALFQSGASSKEFAHEAGTKMPEGAATGALSGATLGGVLGWLAGVGTLAIPGVGPLIAAGPIMAALAGAGVGGAVGGLTGALIGLGIPEYEAKRYEGSVKDGGILLSVHCDDKEWEEKGEAILKECGAENISSTSASSSASGEGTPPHLQAGNL
jgi:hypothetical protein